MSALLREALAVATQLGDVIFFAEHGRHAAIVVRRVHSIFDLKRRPHLCGYVITSSAPAALFDAPVPGGVSFRQSALWLDVLGFDYAVGDPVTGEQPTVEHVAQEARELADWLAAQAEAEETDSLAAPAEVRS